MDHGAYLFDYDQAAEKLHYAYAPETIRRYCEDGILTRGIDFIIRTVRYGSFRWRRRLITIHGIETLLARLSARIPSNHANRRTRTRDTATQDSTNLAPGNQQNT